MSLLPFFFLLYLTMATLSLPGKCELPLLTLYMGLRMHRVVKQPEMQSKAHYKPRVAGTSWVPLVPDSVEIFKGLPGRRSWTTGATCYHSTEVTSLWDLLSLLLHRGHSSPCPGSLSDLEKRPQCAFSDPSNSESIGLPLSTYA